MVGWTEIGQQIQTLSNVCPIPVQTLSSTIKVQGLSNACPTIYFHVQTLSNVCQDPVQTKFSGQTLDMKIQDLSKLCPMKCKQEGNSLGDLRRLVNLGGVLSCMYHST